MEWPNKYKLFKLPHMYSSWINSSTLSKQMWFSRLVLKMRCGFRVFEMRCGFRGFLKGNVVLGFFGKEMWF
jgi:hypothetical protein